MSKLIATSQITLTNVNDGAPSYIHTAYANITKLCNENGSFALQDKSTVRYGFGDKWFYKTLDAGTYTASNTFFGGDPYSGKSKQCDLISDFSLTDSTGRNWLGTYSDNNANAVANPSYFSWQLTKGAQGIQGDDGRTQYTHIAYADDATGGGFSQTSQGKTYIGMYQDFEPIDSNDPTKYRWSKWKGDEGAPGKPGADGKTSYFHIAYADSADGRTGFSFTESGQQYQGYYTDFTQSSSTDPTKYTWMDRRAGIEVGGRNLFLNSKFYFELTKQYSTYYMDASQAQTQGQLVPSIDKNTTFKGANTLKIVSTFNGTRNNQKITFRTGGDDRTGAVDEMKNQSVMMSFWAKSTVANTIMSWRTGFRNPTKELTIGTDWTYYSFQLIAPENSNATNEAILHIWTVATVWVAFPKVERGTISTDHSEAPEDIQANIDSKADQTLTQDQLNALAEKNNLIKAEMEAKASVDTVNQWYTAYQNYVNANDADKAKSEKALKDASERILGIRYEVNNLKYVWDAIDTYMSFQNEGLIIGKKDGSAYAKFSDDRISLFSGSSEVMYISQGTLNIANGIFTKTIQIGRFRFETHPADADMLVIRFVGG